MEKFWKFIKDEDGLETVEYAVMGGLIIVALITAITLLSGNITAGFNRLATTIVTQ